jgi:hypothetical protein
MSGLILDGLAIAAKDHVHGATAFTVGPHGALAFLIGVLSEDELGNLSASGGWGKVRTNRARIYSTTYAQDVLLVLGWRALMLEAFEGWRLSTTLPWTGSEAALLKRGLDDSGDDTETESSHSMSSRLTGNG